MAQLKELADKRGGLLFFKPTRLTPKPGLNTRDYSMPENLAHVDSLAESIRETGVQKPLTIVQGKDGNVLIVDGESRWRACMKLIDEGFSPDMMVPCLEEPRGTSDKARQINLITANSGKNFNAIEAGTAIKRAIALGASLGEIAKATGKSVSWVAQTLDFLAAPAEIHAAVTAGEISHTLAAEIVREKGEEAVETVKAAVETAKSAGKTKATRRHISNSATYSVKDAGGGLLRVTIDGKAFRYSVKFWLGLADQIRTKADPISETRRQLEDA